MTNKEARLNGTFFARMKEDEIAEFLANKCPPGHERTFNPECTIPDGGCLVCWMSWLDEEIKELEVWHLTDDENDEIERGVVQHVDYCGSKVEEFDVLFDNGDFDSFDGHWLGETFFWTKEEAMNALKEE